MVRPPGAGRTFHGVVRASTLLWMMAVAACASRSRPVAPRGLPGLGAVVRVRGVGACLGVRVAPGVVLTAAHCVLGVRSVADIRVASAARTTAASGCALHPVLAGRVGRCDVGDPEAGAHIGDVWADLALVRVTDDPAGAPWLPALAAMPAEGARAFVVADDAPRWVDAPAPRPVPNRVTRVEPGEVRTDGAERADVSTGPGDSGGPLLLLRDGAWVVAGALSGGRHERSGDSRYAPTGAPETAAWLAGFR